MEIIDLLHRCKYLLWVFIQLTNQCDRVAALSEHRTIETLQHRKVVLLLTHTHLQVATAWLLHSLDLQR
jgi:hypothetical protein